MEKEQLMNPIPVMSESTEFELQTEVVRKETEKIQEALIETDISEDSSQDLTEKGSDIDVNAVTSGTVPVLINFKPLSVELSSALEPESIDLSFVQVQIDLPIDDSDERNNNQKVNANDSAVKISIEDESICNIETIGRDTSEKVISAEKILSTPEVNDNDISAVEEQHMKLEMQEFPSNEQIFISTSETNGLEEMQLICDVKEETETLVDVDEPSTLVDKKLLNDVPVSVIEEPEISESVTEVGCCVFIAAPTPIDKTELLKSSELKETATAIINSEETTKPEEQTNAKEAIQKSGTLLTDEVEKLQINEPDPIRSDNANVTNDISAHPSLQDYECHFVWAKDTEGKPFTSDEAQTVECVLYDKFATAMEETSLKYDGVETISNKATQAFCNILMNKMKEGKMQICEAMDLINKCSTTAGDPDLKDYADGMLYVIKGLQMFLLAQQGEDADAKEELERLISTSQPFNFLSRKAQVGVLAMKHFFGTQRRQKGGQQVQLLEKMISFDECHAWYYELYKILRICRRDQNFRSEPDEKEKTVILKAATLAPEHPLINLGLCQCLLEIFKNRNSGRGSWKEKIEMGNVATFKSSQELVDFIKERTEKVLTLHGDSVRANVQVAEFFTVLLPYQFRDNKIAKKCINRALEVSPNSSRANHRMGIFYLTSEHDPIAALKHFERAFETDPRNFPALSDIIQTCLGDPMTNGEHLKKLLKEHLENPIWSDAKVATLHYLNGIFLCMKRENLGAVNSWITAYQKHSDSVKSFKSIVYLSSRYKWNRKDISLMGIETILKKALEERSAEDENEVIGKILEIIAVVAAEIAEKKAFTDANHRGRGGRGSHTSNALSRPTTGIFSSRTGNSSTASVAQPQPPSTHAYRGIGRGNSRGVVLGGERNRGGGNAIIREPRAPEGGRGFAPRGTAGQRGNKSSRGAGGAQPEQK